MNQSIEQMVRQFREGAKRVLRENNTPEKARKFLLRAGIVEKDEKSKGGVRLAKRFR